MYLTLDLRILFRVFLSRYSSLLIIVVFHTLYSLLSFPLFLIVLLLYRLSVIFGRRVYLS